MVGLNWGWIAVMATVPPLAAFAVAWLAWRGGQIVFGNLAGTGVVFASALALILRERLAIQRIEQSCLDAGLACVVAPGPFARDAVYSFLALAEVVALFAWSLRVERMRRNRHYAPEWRR